jgi:hypothetical protein
MIGKTINKIDAFSEVFFAQKVFLLNFVHQKFWEELFGNFFEIVLKRKHIKKFFTKFVQKKISEELFGNF